MSGEPRSNIVLYEPSGRVTNDPAAEYIREALVEEGDDYWSLGCGQLSLNFEPGGVDREMIVTPDDAWRFHLDYVADGDDMDWYTTRNGDHSAPPVTVQVSGEAHLLPGDSFLTAEHAWQAVETFMRDGSRDPRLTWARRSKFVWPTEPELAGD
jgi:hypothetical protein